MAKQNIDRSEEPIDEQYLMAMMAGEEKPKQLPLTPKPPEDKQGIKNEKKPKIKEADAKYEELFLKNANTTARIGKSVYIRPEFHERLSRIVQVIGEDKITIYAYLDNLLDYHFKEFGTQITESFNDKYKPIL